MQLFGFTFKEIALLLIGTLLGLVGNHYSNRITAKSKGLCYSIRRQELYSYRWKPNSDFKVYFKDRGVYDPRRVVVYVWNDRDTTVDASDVPEIDPIRYTASGIEILHVGEAISTRAAVGGHIDVLPDRTGIVFRFDFLDPGDGIAVEVFFDARNDDRNEPTMLGAIKGVRGEPRFVLYNNIKRRRFFAYVGVSLGLALGACAFILGYEAWGNVSISHYAVIAQIIGAMFTTLFAIGSIGASIQSLVEQTDPVVPASLTSAFNPDSGTARWDRLREEVLAGVEQFADLR